MLVTPDLGKERWKIVRNLFECFLGTRLIGETWKFGKGGVGKGPATRRKATSFIRLAVTTLGCSNAFGKFRENLGTRGPLYPISAPYRRLLHKRKTNKRSGWSTSTLSRLLTLIGEGKDPVNASLSPVRFGVKGSLVSTPCIVSIPIPGLPWCSWEFGAVMSRVCTCTLVTDMLETSGRPEAPPKTIEVMASASAFAPS